MSYPYPYELYKRVDESPGKEKYISLATFAKRPSVDEMNDAFEGKPRYATDHEPELVINSYTC